jgi:tagatose 6-phosphate kinase
MILCVGTTPAVQRVMVFERLVLDAVNRATQTLVGVAGKSVNVAKVLHALGEKPLAVGVAGGDSGRFILDVLHRRGIETEFIEVSARTRQCTTLLDQSTGRQTELVEESAPVETDTARKLHAVLSNRLRQSRAVIMSGTLAPGIPTTFYRDAVAMANANGLLSVVDARGTALETAMEAGPGLVKPNHAELEATLGRSLPDEPAVVEGMRELLQRGARRVVVTAGKHPTLAADATGCWRVANPPIHVVNAIGSGDSVTAGIVWKLLEGATLDEACRWGSAAGAANALSLMPGDLECADVRRLAPLVKVELVSRW